jgi:hypothetical protein
MARRLAATLLAVAVLALVPRGASGGWPVACGALGASRRLVGKGCLLAQPEPTALSTASETHMTLMGGKHQA